MKKELKNLIDTAKDVALEFSKTGKLLNKNPDNRMRICQACECYENNFCSRNKCNKEGCGCFMPVKVKLEAATCPKKKW